MSNNLQENKATPMPPRENISARDGRKTSLPCMTREEGRAMMAEYKEDVNRFMAYAEEINLFSKFRLPSTTQVPHLEDSEKKSKATGLE